MAHAGLVEEVIDVGAVSATVECPENGAVVLFVGTVRNHFDGRAVQGITYDVHAEMAAREITRLVAEEEAAHDGLRAALVHRFGPVAVGEASVVIAVSSPHRDLAYESNRRLLERLKREVPIWKHEHYDDGTSTWREVEPLGGAG